tara:strand:- start:15653 stop:15826 length:174 start_codon:yes stop_codon:yes gene_type:complete
MIKYVVIISMLALVGCGELEQQMIEHQTRGQIECAPADAQGCIGWLGNKPIMVEEEV